MAETYSPAGTAYRIAGASSARDPSERLAIDLANVFLSVIIALALIFTPVAAHGALPVFGVLLALGLSAACAWYLPQVALISVIAGFLFQNLFVSFFVDMVQDKPDFDFIRGYNFLTLSVVWLTTILKFLFKWNYRDKSIDIYIKMTIFILSGIGLYFIIGFMIYGIIAIIYLRNIITPLLFFHICLLMFASQPLRVGPMLTAMGVLAALCGFVEAFSRDAWLYWTNGYAFWDMAAGANWATLAYDKAAAATGIVATGMLDLYQTDFLNSPLTGDFGFPMTRLFGPNMHAISFAYALTFFLIFALFRGRWLQAALLFVLVFLCNAKGPLILLLLVMGGWVLFRLFGAGFAFAGLAAAMVLYIVLGVLVGLNVGDYHVLGFMAAVYEFPFNPIGHGIGAGGNLSPQFKTINWPEAQALGRTPFPVESSVGVLMHHLGLFAFVLVGGYIWLAWRVMRIARDTGNNLQAAAAMALMAMTANGVFQEEAYFAPLALALYLGLAGMIIGAAIRTGIERETSPAPGTGRP